MQVQEVMHRPVHVVNLTTQSRDAAKLMRDAKVGVLPVVSPDQDDRVLGMVTDRDIVVRAVAENRPPSNAAVSTVMSEGVYYCFDDDPVETAARVMAEHQVRRLPVLNREQRLVGIVSLGDLARRHVKEAEVMAIEGISQPSDQPRR